MRRRLATTLLAALALASAGASKAGSLGQGQATAPADPPGARHSLVRLDAGSVDATALPREGRGRMTTYAYLEREGANTSRYRARDSGSGASPSSEPQPAPAATNYAVVPGSATPGRASPIPAIAALFASTLGGLGVLLRCQRTGRREA
jgi:hypothetical protein